MSGESGRIPPPACGPGQRARQGYLSRVGDALGTTAYRTIFGLAPGQPIVLVDPQVAALVDASAAL